jgi:hypothetical protein
LRRKTHDDGQQEGFKRFGILLSQFSLGRSDQGLYVEGGAILEALARLELDTREGQGIRQADACKMLIFERIKLITQCPLQHTATISAEF